MTTSANNATLQEVNLCAIEQIPHAPGSIGEHSAASPATAGGAFNSRGGGGDVNPLPGSTWRTEGQRAVEAEALECRAGSSPASPAKFEDVRTKTAPAGAVSFALPVKVGPPCRDERAKGSAVALATEPPDQLSLSEFSFVPDQEQPDMRGRVYCDSKFFAHAFKLPADWGKESGRWVVNRDKLAFALGYPASGGSFRTVVEMLRAIQLHCGGEA